MTEKDRKEGFIVASVAMIALLTLLGSMYYETYVPKFEVGDCIRLWSKGNEFEEPHFYGQTSKVLKVGKKYYLLQTGQDKTVTIQGKQYTLNRSEQETELITWQKLYKKVECDVH